MSVFGLSLLLIATAQAASRDGDDWEPPRCQIRFDRLAQSRRVVAQQFDLARLLGFDDPNLTTPEMGKRAIRYVANLTGMSAAEKAAVWRRLVTIIGRSGHTFTADEFRGSDGSFIFQAGKDFNLYSLVFRPDGTVWRGKLAQPLRRAGTDGAKVDDVWPADYTGYWEVQP